MAKSDWSIPVLPKTATWLCRTGIFGNARPGDLMAKPRSQLWTDLFGGAWPFPEDMPPSAVFALYRRLKINLVGADHPHVSSILELIASDLGRKKRGAKIEIERRIGRSTREERDRIHRLQGLEPENPTRPMREGTIDDLVSVLPEHLRAVVKCNLIKAGQRGRELKGYHIGRVMGLQIALQPIGVMVLLDASWQNKALTTIQKYLGALEFIDDRLREAGDLRLHRLLARLNREVDELSPTQRVLIRSYALAMSSARRFVRQRFSGSAAFWLARPLSDPRSLIAVSEAAVEVIAQRNDDSELERVDQVLFELEQSRRMDRLVEERQRTIEIIFNAYVEALASAPADVDAESSFEALIPVIDEAGGSSSGAEQYIRFKIKQPARILADVATYDPEYAAHYRLEKHCRRLAASGPALAGELREDLLCVYVGLRPALPGGPTSEPFFIDIYRWGILEGRAKHSPFIEEVRQLTIEAAGLEKNLLPPVDIFSPPRSLAWIAAHARGSDPREGRVAVPIVALHHGMILSALSHTIARANCPRIGELMQVQLGKDYVKGRILGTDRYRLMMRPKASRVLKTYHVPAAALGLIRKSVKLAVRRWFPHLAGEQLLLPLRQHMHISLNDLPAGQYVFSNCTRCLRQDEVQLIRHIGLWRLTSSTMHVPRHVLATKFGLAGSRETLTARALQQRRGSRQPRRYDHSAELLAASATHAHANAEEKFS